MHRILVVDDEELAPFTLREILESAGYEVAEARNGKECVDKQRASPFDLVITDIIMPEQEGIQTITEMRSDKPDAKIIAISGGGRIGNTDFLKMAQQYGADAILAKPFTDEQLLDLVKEQLKYRGLPQT